MTRMENPSATARTRKIFLYFGPLTLLVFLIAPEYVLDIPTSYMLKNQLHATASQVSMFRLLTGFPLYFGFLFGLARDRWNPFGWRDRGYFRIFALLMAGVFAWMAVSPLSYQGLLTGMILAMISFRFITAAYQGLLTLIGQEELMSGRLSSLWNVFSTIPYVAAIFVSGYIAEHLSPAQTFFLAIGLVLPVLLISFWKPDAVFSHAYNNPLAQGADFWGDVKRLVKHRAIYPAALMNFLLFFVPGSSTPLQFYLTNQLHASDAVFSYYFGILQICMCPMFLLYGFLCTKFPARTLLWCAAIIELPELIPLLFIHSGNSAMLMAVPIGLMGGLAQVAFWDLAMRSCPPGLQGTFMTLVYALWMLALRGSDVLGAAIFSMSPEHGFLYCVIATTVVYILILPVILLVPKDLIATADGEANPEVEAGVLSEIAGTGPVAGKA